MTVRFIDDHRDAHGIESICAVVPIAPSTYFLHKAQQRDPTQVPAGYTVEAIPARGAPTFLARPSAP